MDDNYIIRHINTIKTGMFNKQISSYQIIGWLYLSIVLLLVVIHIARIPTNLKRLIKIFGFKKHEIDIMDKYISKIEFIFHTLVYFGIGIIYFELASKH